MTITAVGFQGSVGEADIARLAAHFASEYSVSAAGDLQVRPVANADRTVSVAQGEVYAHFVLATSDAAVTVASPLVPSGSRWDAIVARFDWTASSGTLGQPGFVGGRVTLEVVPGGTELALPAGVARSPGVRFDVPLALVQYTAGRQQPNRVVDLRVRLLGGIPHVGNADAAQVYRRFAGVGYPRDDRDFPDDVPMLPAIQARIADRGWDPAPLSIIERDLRGRAKVTDPEEPGDIATRRFVEDAALAIAREEAAAAAAAAGRVTKGPLSLNPLYRPSGAWTSPAWHRQGPVMRLQGVLEPATRPYRADANTVYPLGRLPSGTAPGADQFFPVAFGTGATFAPAAVYVRAGGGLDFWLSSPGADSMVLSLSGITWRIGE